MNLYYDTTIITLLKLTKRSQFVYITHSDRVCFKLRYVIACQLCLLPCLHRMHHWAEPLCSGVYDNKCDGLPTRFDSAREGFDLCDSRHALDTRTRIDTLTQSCVYVKRYYGALHQATRCRQATTFPQSASLLFKPRGALPLAIT